MMRGVTSSRLHYLPCLVTVLTLISFATTQSGSTVTLKASGGDDGPSFVSAVLSDEYDTVVIPSGTTLNISSKMDMTSAKDKHILVEGTVKFNPDISYWVTNAFNLTFQKQIAYWLLGGDNVLLNGGGILDGSGQDWYEAFEKNSSLLRPIILTIINATNVAVDNITMLNSPEWFNLISQSVNVTYSNMNLSAVSTSSAGIHNTDGWNTYRSDQVVIKDCVINNGDDCVSFKPNSTNILVSNLTCNGSHGISVGSLGQYAGKFDIVENITSTNIRMANAQNGARIKAWAGKNVGSGIVKNITFEHFIESAVDHPIIIDQCYFTTDEECKANPSNTLIQDVVFSDITGTGTRATVANIDCSPGGRCSNITVDGISLTGNEKSVYECENVVLSGDSAGLFGNCTST